MHLPTANRKFTVWPYPLKPRQLNGKARSVPFSFGATSASQARALGGLRRPTMPRAKGFKSFRLKLKQILMVVRKVKLLRKAKNGKTLGRKCREEARSFPFSEKLSYPGAPTQKNLHSFVADYFEKKAAFRKLADHMQGSSTSSSRLSLYLCLRHTLQQGYPLQLQVVWQGHTCVPSTFRHRDTGARLEVESGAVAL